MTAFLGGFEITDVRRVGLAAVRVDVVSDFDDRHFQLYAGRRLIGVSRTAGDLYVVGQLPPAHCPHPLTVVMCEATERFTDFGAQLPPRPFNQFQIGWSAASFPDDAKWFEITAATEAGGEVDPDNVVSRIAYLGDGAYLFILPPVDAPGTWNYNLDSRDDSIPRGNQCPTGPVEVSLETYPYPPDLANDEDGTRLTPDVTAGILTVSYAYDW